MFSGKHNHPLIVLSLLLKLALSGCTASVMPGPTVSPTLAPQATAAIVTAAPTTTLSPTTATFAPALTASPTPDSGIITSANAARLAVLRSMGMGSLQGRPRYSPDGQWLAISTTTGVYLYDTTDYRTPRLLTPIHNEHLTFSPDGQMLAVGNHLIDLKDGQPLAVFDLPGVAADWTARIHDLAFSTDGQQIAIAFSYDDFDWAERTGGPKIGVFQTTDGHWLKTFPGENTHFSPDGRYLFSRVAEDVSTGAYRLRIYDWQTDALLSEWPGERGGLLPGKRAYVEADGVVRIYNLETGKVPQAFNGQFAAFSPDGLRLVLLSQGQIHQYQTTDGAWLGTLEGDFTAINQAELRYSPDGQTIAAAAREDVCCGGSANASFSLWRNDGSLIQRFASAGPPVTRFEFSSDGGSLLFDRIQTDDVHIWNVADGISQATLTGFTAPVTRLVFLPDGQQLVVATYGNSLNPLLFYQVESGWLNRMIPTNINAPDYGLAVRPDGQVLALSNTFWRVSDGELLSQPITKICGETCFAAHGVVFSPDGHLLARSTLGGILQLWDFDTTTLVSNQIVCGEYGIAESLSFSPDGQRLALACDTQGEGDSFVQVYSAAANAVQRLSTLQGVPGSTFNLVSYSPDGQYLAAAGLPAPDGMICPVNVTSAQVWRAADGQPLATLLTGCVASLAFSPDGQLLALGLLDGAVEIWSLPAAEKIISLPGSPHNSVNALAFSPDGTLLAAGYSDGSVKLWGLEK